MHSMILLKLTFGSCIYNDIIKSDSVYSCPPAVLVQTVANACVILFQSDRFAWTSKDRNEAVHIRDSEQMETEYMTHRVYEVTLLDLIVVFGVFN